MSKFLKLTDHHGGTPILVNLAAIRTISRGFDGGAFIVTREDESLKAQESYDSVAEQLYRAGHVIEQ